MAPSKYYLALLTGDGFFNGKMYNLRTECREVNKTSPTLAHLHLKVLLALHYFRFLLVANKARDFLLFVTGQRFQNATVC